MSPRQSATSHPSDTRAHEALVGEGHAGQRLDNFVLRELKNVPRTRVYRAIRKGEVRINGRRARGETRVEAGDRVRLPPLSALQPKVAANPDRAPTLPVLYEDEWLLAIDKPFGLPVHAGSGTQHGVIEYLRAMRNDAFLELVHRIDADTSGVLLLARRRDALLAVQAELRERGEISKHYRAIVHGRVAWKHHSERSALANAKGVAQEARSDFHCLQQNAAFSECRVDIHSGRKHQIRRHAKHFGHPLVGDEKYGQGREDRRLPEGLGKRLYLHAERLQFRHPQSGRKLDIGAPVPAAFADLMRRDQIGSG